jgi:hypothetical protein
MLFLLPSCKKHIKLVRNDIDDFSDNTHVRSKVQYIKNDI